MGADNWRVCPKCKRAAEAERRRKQLVAGEAYGEVSSEAYLELLEKANRPIDLAETLREDYSIGINDDGKFYVSYRGGCQVCDFDHTFKHEEVLLKATATGGQQ